MDLITCGMVNGPFTILGILVNIFFMFCMVCPLHGQQIKQPLKLLLGTLICCTITYTMSFLVHYTFLITRYMDLMLIPYLAFVFTLSISMSSSVWLNFFFFAQIVPAQRAIFIWIKKNIKTVIYCIWLFDKILGLLDVCVVLIEYYTPSYLISGAISHNFTIYNDTIYLQMRLLVKNAYGIASCFVKANFIFCLCVMVLSGSSTIFYLCKHMRRMVANGQPLSCSRFRSQVRVTLTGILQGILYAFCVLWNMSNFFSEYSPPLGYTFIHITVINLYMVGTTFNLGAGQSLFRQRVADIWHRAIQWFKGSDVQAG